VSENVSRSVYSDDASRFLAPFGEQIAAGFVFIREGHAANTTFGGRADLRHRHETSHKAFPVDAHRFLIFIHMSSLVKGRIEHGIHWILIAHWFFLGLAGASHSVSISILFVIQLKTIIYQVFSGSCLKVKSDWTVAAMFLACDWRAGSNYEFQLFVAIFCVQIPRVK
jgi:hypothetical protein